MSTNTLARGKGQLKTERSRFQQLWSEAEELEKENLALAAELEELVKRIDADVFQAERKLGQVIYDAVSRQLEFSQKKSLLKWQRAELSEWIDENLLELEAMGLFDNALRDKLALLRADELGVVIDPNSELSAAEQLGKYFEDDEAQTHRQCSGVAQDDSGQSDLFAEEAEDHFHSEYDDIHDEELAELVRKMREHLEEFQDNQNAESTKPGRKNLRDTVFKRLFRQTATALHPDKEIDAQRRQEKHELMAQLLKARTEHDLITILRLHEKYASATSELSSDDQQQLEGILVEYLSQQQQRQDEIIRKSPIHHMAFTEFYHKKPATVTRRINAHLKKIEEKKEGLQFFISQVKTLKALKEILAARYDASMWRNGW